MNHNVSWCCVFGKIMAYTAVILLYFVQYCPSTAVFVAVLNPDAVYLLQSWPVQLYCWCIWYNTVLLLLYLVQSCILMYYCCVWYNTVLLQLYLVQSCILILCIWCHPGLYSCFTFVFGTLLSYYCCIWYNPVSWCITVVFGTMLPYYCCIWCNPVSWGCVFGAILAQTAL